MQTFLPYADFKRSAQVLDRQRLGKQRVETLQLLQGLAGQKKNGWVNHPCSKMWRGHEFHLIRYGIECCSEWLSRGYKDTCTEKISEFFKIFPLSHLPSWMGSEPFHLSHRSNLMRKAPEYYSEFFPEVRNDIPYIWPV